MSPASWFIVVRPTPNMRWKYEQLVARCPSASWSNATRHCPCLVLLISAASVTNWHIGMSAAGRPLRMFVRTGKSPSGTQWMSRCASAKQMWPEAVRPIFFAVFRRLTTSFASLQFLYCRNLWQVFLLRATQWKSLPRRPFPLQTTENPSTHSLHHWPNRSRTVNTVQPLSRWFQLSIQAGTGHPRPLLFCARHCFFQFYAKLCHFSGL